MMDDGAFFFFFSLFCVKIVDRKGLLFDLSFGRLDLLGLGELN